MFDTLAAAHGASVVCPLFRPQSERHRDDQLAWDDNSNGISNKGYYSRNYGKKGVEMTSYEVMDRIVARLLKRVKSQIVVAGFSRWCQFVQRWMLVSDIPFALFQKAGFRISTVFTSCSTYGFLDFYRPTSSWKQKNCLGAKKAGQSQECSDPAPPADEEKTESESHWTRDMAKQLPDKIWAKYKGADNSGLELVDLGDFQKYLPMLASDREKRYRPSDAYDGAGLLQKPYVSPAFLDRAEGFKKFDPGKTPKTIEMWEVSKYLRQHVLPRFQVSLVLNRGDRRLDLVHRPHFHWTKNSLSSAERNAWLFQKSYLAGLEWWQTFSDYVDTTLLAITQGFHRYHRAQVYKWWLNWHVPGATVGKKKTMQWGSVTSGKYGFRAVECNDFCTHQHQTLKIR
eukprot:g20435.t1